MDVLRVEALRRSRLVLTQKLVDEEEAARRRNAGRGKKQATSAASRWGRALFASRTAARMNIRKTTRAK